MEGSFGEAGINAVDLERCFAETGKAGWQNVGRISGA
jgi:hypothetical protein